MLYINWGIALFSMVTSLIFSESMHLPPCSLCWYQRIFMYPLVFIIPVGIIRRDQHIGWYTFILSLIGLLIAAYHNLIYYEVVEEGFKLCSAGLSCKTKMFELFGFLSIPTMSLLAFIIIAVLSIVQIKSLFLDEVKK